MIFLGDSPHQRGPDPAHHLQRVLADGARQGGDARPRPRPPQGDCPPLCHTISFFLHLTTYCRTVTLTVTTRTPTPALHLDSPAPPSGGKILFSQKVHGSTLELAASQKHRFLRPRNVANFAKVAIFVAVKMSKGRSQQDIFMPRNIVNRAHLTLG